MNFKQILLGGFIGGIIIFAIAMIVGQLVRLVFPYNVLELGGMRAVNDPVMALFFAYPWIISFAMAIAYQCLKPAFTSKGFVRNGKKLGLIAWLLYSVPSFFVVWSSMNYPIGFHVSQLVGGLLYSICAGIVVAKLAE